MTIIDTPIIPDAPRIFPRHTRGELDRESICIFSAIGFFLGKDDWFVDRSALQPACRYELDNGGQVQSETPYWRWHYAPRDITLRQATEEFAHLFEGIVKRQTQGKQVILPLSGGLDSRTLAAALKGRKDVCAFSYAFPHGIPETRYGKDIADALGFAFRSFEVPKGYLWNNVDRLAEITGCQAEFTHPRQLAFLDQYASMGELFLLGHWGDVLFDDMGVNDEMPFQAQVDVILKKILKRGGLDLGSMLWNAWGLSGAFKEYLRARIESLLRQIDIENANARIRAFKSMYWAPRWTSVNLQVFAAARPMVLPYYHDDMCRFICTVPESLLAGRQIQIEYLKMQTPELARIPWQAHSPFNLYTYPWNRTPWNVPYRIAGRIKRSFSSFIGKPFVTRNWELQFLGKSNQAQLQHRLMDSPVLHEFIPAEVTHRVWDGFWTKDNVQYAHPMSMLLTFAEFAGQKEKTSE